MRSAWDWGIPCPPARAEGEMGWWWWGGGLTGVSGEEREEALLARVDHVDLVQAHHVDDLTRGAR